MQEKRLLRSLLVLKNECPPGVKPVLIDYYARLYTSEIPPYNTTNLDLHTIDCFRCFQTPGGLFLQVNIINYLREFFNLLWTNPNWICVDGPLFLYPL